MSNNKLAVTFNVTKNLNILKKDWKKLSNRSRISGTNSKHKEDFGGLFAILDLSKKRIINKVQLPQPTGFVISNGGIFVNSMKENCIYRLSTSLKVEDRITNPLFNDLHTIVKTTRGFLVTSTGIDTILEVGRNGETLWSHWLTDEKKYSRTPGGSIRIISKDLDHRNYSYSTLEQTTHVNSATYKDENSILATLFHQGIILEVDRKTGRTKKITNGLWCPHSIRRYKNSWLLSDSRNNSAILYNRDFTSKKVFKGDFDWVQDALLDEKTDRLFIADSNKHRIIVVDLATGLYDQIGYSKKWRIFRMELI